MSEDVQDWEPVEIPFTPPEDDAERLAFLKRRQSGLGGSDAGAILGVNPYKSSYQVWLEKTDPDSACSRMNEPMHWGIALEDQVAAEFARRMDMTLERVDQQLEHDRYPYIIANIDRQVAGKPELVEIKTASAYAKQAWLDDGPPLYYRAQVAQYLAVTGYDRAWIACLFGGQSLHAFRVERDEELMQFVVDKLDAFWRDHVLTGIPPEVDNRAVEYLTRRYPFSNGEALSWTGSPKHEALLTALYARKQEADESKARYEDIKAQVMRELGANECATAEHFQVTWKSTKPRTYVDVQGLREHHPAIVSAYTVAGEPSRRFTIKRLKQKG